MKHSNRLLHVAAAIFGLLPLAAIAQNQATPKPARPKLVVGIVVDQMRWDFLYRYADRYRAGGFQRMLSEGFTAENTHIPYAQTVTAAGHACVYTGSTPALNGIMGNEWYDRQLGRDVYCVEDTKVQIVGGTEKSEPMSPANLWATTVSDELRLATNRRSKVVGVAIKDRGSILPAGHLGTAYWYESANGNWVSSTYYMNQLPGWVNQFNSRKMVDSLYAADWNTLYPINTYNQSDTDNNAYEGATPNMPKPLKPFIGKNYGAIRSTPQGNTLTLEFAKAALLAEQLGADAETDMLAVSLSSPDYIGHAYGPNSIEIEDTYLRLDRELEQFFTFLDKQVGKGSYTVFLTADHGVAHVPGYLSKLGMGLRTIPSNTNDLNAAVKAKFGIEKAIMAGMNYQLYLNHKAIDSAEQDAEEVADFLVKELRKLPHVANAFSYLDLEDAMLPADLRERFAKGYNPKLAGDVQVLLKPGFFYGGSSGTTHGSWYPYDSHIPNVWMGWGIPKGHTTRPTAMTDIAATVAALLRIQMPSACIGQPIAEITHPK